MAQFVTLLSGIAHFWRWPQIGRSAPAVAPQPVLVTLRGLGDAEDGEDGVGEGEEGVGECEEGEEGAKKMTGERRKEHTFVLFFHDV